MRATKGGIILLSTTDAAPTRFSGGRLKSGKLICTGYRVRVDVPSTCFILAIPTELSPSVKQVFSSTQVNVAPVSIRALPTIGITTDC